MKTKPAEIEIDLSDGARPPAKPPASLPARSGRRGKSGKPGESAKPNASPRAPSLFRSLSICPFTIIVDTREQLPYTFDDMQEAGREIIVPVIRLGLESGDYSLEGFQDKIAIERKSLQDLYGTLGAGRERFEREFERLAKMDFAAVVIEASATDILHPDEADPCWHSRLDPRSVEGTIAAWSVRYPVVHWWPMGTRRQAEERVFGVLKAWWKEQTQKRKA
ncbi:MAG: ERCC4 domain-containing protein [Planctomycetaceae bacterium]